MNEQELIKILKKSKRTLLIEPNYKRKYLPLGLAKISTFIKKNGGDVKFKRYYTPIDEDLVCVTSLFTYDSQKVLDVLNQIRTWGSETKVIIGGIYASLMPEHIKKKFPNVEIFQGYSQELDLCSPDYSINWDVDEKWEKFSFVFTTRGCPNRCPYCAVWRIEPKVWINPDWKEHIDLNRPYVMISDNNLSAQPIEHFREICNFLIKNNKRVVFDNGFDCKQITKEFAELLGKLKYVKTGCRLAFDRIEEDGIFQKSVELLIKSGVPKSSLMAYVLFNFTDTPQEAIYRAEECVRLGIRPYPQKYTPLNSKSRKEPYIGKYWTKNLSRAFRYFFLMAGHYTKHHFVDWIKEEVKNGNKLKLTKKDLECLEKDYNVSYKFHRAKELREHRGSPTLTKNMGEGGHQVPMVNIQNFVRTGEWGDGFRDDGSSFTLQGSSGRDLAIARVLDANMWKGIDPEGFYKKKKRNLVLMENSNAVTPDAYLTKGERKRVDGKAVLTSMHERRLRRLTPIECERLQGFPDNWTEGVSDTQRYKQMGNAVTVNVIEAIARRLIQSLN